MRQEGKRKKTIEQLKRKEGITLVITLMSIVMLFGDFWYIAIMSYKNKVDSKSIIVFLIIGFISCCVMRIFSKTLSNTTTQIALKEQELKVDEIKEMRLKALK